MCSGLCCTFSCSSSILFLLLFGTDHFQIFGSIFKLLLRIKTSVSCRQTSALRWPSGGSASHFWASHPCWSLKQILWNTLQFSVYFSYSLKENWGAKESALKSDSCLPASPDFLLVGFPSSPASHVCVRLSSFAYWHHCLKGDASLLVLAVIFFGRSMLKMSLENPAWLVTETFELMGVVMVWSRAGFAVKLHFLLPSSSRLNTCSPLPALLRRLRQTSDCSLSWFMLLTFSKLKPVFNIKWPWLWGCKCSLKLI